MNYRSSFIIKKKTESSTLKITKVNVITLWGNNFSIHNPVINVEKKEIPDFVEGFSLCRLKNTSKKARGGKSTANPERVLRCKYQGNDSVSFASICTHPKLKIFLL